MWTLFIAADLRDLHTKKALEPIEVTFGSSIDSSDSQPQKATSSKEVTLFMATDLRDSQFENALLPIEVILFISIDSRDVHSRKASEPTATTS